jgi:hypothetical protein
LLNKKEDLNSFLSWVSESSLTSFDSLSHCKSVIDENKMDLYSALLPFVKNKADLFGYVIEHQHTAALTQLVTEETYRNKVNRYTRNSHLVISAALMCDSDLFNKVINTFYEFPPLVSEKLTPLLMYIKSLIAPPLLPTRNQLSQISQQLSGTTPFSRSMSQFCDNISQLNTESLSKAEWLALTTLLQFATATEEKGEPDEISFIESAAARMIMHFIPAAIKASTKQNNAATKIPMYLYYRLIIKGISLETPIERGDFEQTVGGYPLRLSKTSLPSLELGPVYSAIMALLDETLQSISSNNMRQAILTLKIMLAQEHELTSDEAKSKIDSWLCLHDRHDQSLTIAEILRQQKKPGHWFFCCTSDTESLHERLFECCRMASIAPEPPL